MNIFVCVFWDGDGEEGEIWDLDLFSFDLVNVASH